MIARARTDVARLPAVMRQASRTVAPHVAAATRLMRDDFVHKLQAPHATSVVAVLTALLALALASIGIAGVVSYLAERRLKEVGIRLALGATAAAIVRTLLGGFGFVGAIGALVGVGGGWVVGRLFAGQPLYVEPLDAVPYATAAIAVAFSASLAALWPAVRVLRADPLKALRVD